MVSESTLTCFGGILGYFDIREELCFVIEMP